MSLLTLVRPQPFTVAVGPVVVTVPPAMADEWLLALCAPEHMPGVRYSAVVPGMLDAEGQGALAAALVAGDVTPEQVEAAGYEAITAAGGRQWWQVLALVGSADRPGGVTFGSLLLDGVDPARVTLAGWVAATYVVIARGLDEKGMNEFEAGLLMPPAGVVADTSGWDATEW